MINCNVSGHKRGLEDLGSSPEERMPPPQKRMDFLKDRMNLEISKQKKLIEKIQAADFKEARRIVEVENALVNSVYRKESPLVMTLAVCSDLPDGDLQKKGLDFCEYLIERGASTESKEESIVFDLGELFFNLNRKKVELSQGVSSKGEGISRIEAKIFEVFELYPYFLEINHADLATRMDNSFPKDKRSKKLSFLETAKRMELDTVVKKIEEILESRVLSCKSEEDLKGMIEKFPDWAAIHIQGFSLHAYALSKGYQNLAAFLEERVLETLQERVLSEEDVMSLGAACLPVLEMKINGKPFFEWAFSKKMHQVVGTVLQILGNKIAYSTSEEQVEEIVKNFSNWPLIQVNGIPLYEYIKAKKYEKLAEFLKEKGYETICSLSTSKRLIALTIIRLLTYFPEFLDQKIEGKSPAEWALSRGFDVQGMPALIEKANDLFQSLILEENPSEDQIIDLLKSNPESAFSNVKESQGIVRPFIEIVIEKEWFKVLNRVALSQGPLLLFRLIQDHRWNENEKKDEERIHLIQELKEKPYSLSIDGLFSNEQGSFTPLMYFINQANLKLVKVCVEKLNADVNKGDFKEGEFSGKSPLGLAFSLSKYEADDSKQAEVFQYLKNLEADLSPSEEHLYDSEEFML